MNSTKSVPYNSEAEIYILGSVFLDNNVIDSLIGKIVPSDFYDEKNQLIYQAMQNLRLKKQLIQPISVADQLLHDKVAVDDNFKNYILDMIDSVPSTVSSAMYINIVEEKSLERKLLQSMQELSDDILLSRLDFNDVLDKTEDQMLNIIKNRRTTNFITVGVAADETLAKIETIQASSSNTTGLDTGYPKLNKATLGFQPGNLIILAARPSVGKSNFALNLALNTCVKNKEAKVAVFSLEMSVEQIMMRLYAHETGISMSRIQSGSLTSNEFSVLALVKSKFKQMSLYFDESSSTNIVDIRTKCRQLKQSNGLDFIIIDYLQLVTSTLKGARGNRQEEVSQISRQLKTLARELNVPVLALSQLSRSIETRENKEPQLSDLRESGSIEQDADLVMFLYRRSDVEESNDENGSTNLEEQRRNIADELSKKVEAMSNLSVNNSFAAGKDSEVAKSIDIILSIEKNRQGPTTFIDYRFYGASAKFVEETITKDRPRKKSKRAFNNARN